MIKNKYEEELLKKISSLESHIHQLKVENESLMKEVIKRDELLEHQHLLVQNMRISNRIKNLPKNYWNSITEKITGLISVNNIVLKDDNVKTNLFQVHESDAKKYRITIITPSTNIHGGTKRLLMIAELLHKRGHSVNFVRQFKSRNLDWFNFSIPVLDINFNEKSNLKDVAMQLPSADFLITYGNNRANNLIDQLPEDKGIKTALYMHFGVHDNALDIDNLKLKNFEFLATTNWIAENMRKHTKKKVQVIDFGVHSDQFYPTNLKRNKKRIGTLLHKDDWKRSQDVIDAIKILKAEGKKIDLVMFGQVEKPILGFDFEYHHNPSQDELRDIYSSCYAWVMPSEYEGIGMCSVEAMLCKTPLITTNTGGSEDFCNKLNAFYTDKRNPLKLAKTIQYLIKHPKEAEKKAERAYKDILTHSWSRSISLLEDALTNTSMDKSPIGLKTIDYELSIGIPIHNQLDYVKNCIESVYKHTSKKFQLILVDDVSDIETKNYLKKISDTYNNVTYIRNEGRKGFPFNCNRIITNSRAKFVCLLNSDTVVTKNWDRYLCEPLIADPKLMITGPSTSYGVAKNFDSIAQQLPEVHNERFDMTIDDIESFSEQLYFDKKNEKVLYTEYVNGFCMMIRSEAFKEVGLLDTDFGFGSREEVQFVDRLRTENFEVGWVKYAYVHHYGNRSFNAYPDSKELWEKNKILYHSTKGKKKLVDTTTLKVAFIYGDKYASSTRKRTFEPYKYLKNLIDIDTIHWPRVTNDYIRSKDIIVFQRLGGLNEVIKDHFIQEITKWTNEYQFKNKYFIYDIDDLVIQSQNKLPIKLMKICDAVTVTTESLKKNVEKWNKNVTVVKNGVDSLRFDAATPTNKNDKVKSIVYFSLAGCGAEEADQLAASLNKLQPKQYEVLFFSSALPKDDARFSNLKILDNVTLDVLFSYLKSADYVINWGEHSEAYLNNLNKKYSLPKKDYKNFIDSKSGLKYYNAALAKCIFFTTAKPSVYSELVKNRHNGFIIKNIKEVISTILKLEKNKKLKTEIIENAYLDIISNYTLNNTSYEYLQFFCKVQNELESNHSSSKQKAIDSASRRKRMKV